MTVLSDGFTASQEEMTRIQQLRAMGQEAHGPGIEVHGRHTSTELRGSEADHTPDLTPTRGTHELHEQAPRRETEPHGMYWDVGPDGIQRLKPQPWFIKKVATDADHIFALTREAIGSDEGVIKQYQNVGDALREYIEQRVAINDMVGKRKFKQELDDAAYQFCQAAKYKIDAEERARFLVERSEDALDNEQINNLIERAQQAAHEGFVLAYALRHAGWNESMDLQNSARRVLDYSCRRLTEWFAERRKQQANQQKLTVDATKSIITNMFLKSGRRS